MAVPNPVPEATKALIREFMEYDHTQQCVVWKNPPSKNIKAGDRLRACVSVTVAGVRIWYHRLVWFLAYGYFPSCGIIHRNGDNGDNSLDNLIIPQGRKRASRPAPDAGYSPIVWERFNITMDELQDFAARGVGVADDAKKAAWAIKHAEDNPDYLPDDPTTGQFRIWGLEYYQT